MLGDNGYGQLGLGNTTYQTSPTQVGSVASWTRVDAGFNAACAGGYHSCAARTDNTLWCWGYNWYGQLGDGTTTLKASPVQVA